MKAATRRSLLLSGLASSIGVAGIAVGLWVGGGPDRAEGEAPLIGIATTTHPNYLRALRKAGGIPVVLPDTEADEAAIDGYLARLDGLLLPGGADIPPAEYGEEPHETVVELDEDRYRFEKALAGAWIERTDKPLLGICLGGQWINVVNGGSLVQDIPSEFGISHRDREHPVSLEADSRLAEILGRSSVEVNSSHHQAVKRLGDGLRIVARCPDGVVEATEGADPDRFLVGVQWHPERLVDDRPEQKRIFEAFVEACRAARPPDRH